MLQLEKANRDVETTVTARYEGDRTDDFTYLQVDVRELPAGVYKLTVSTTDLLSRGQDKRDVLFRVID